MFPTVALILSALAAISGAVPGVDHVPVARSTPNNKVIVQMFQWNWPSVAAECTEFIGPNGYGFVQVSPPSEHIEGDQWWTDYQVVSYTLTSKRGTRAQFQSMIQTCNAAGVEVIADTIWNHMTGQASGTGVAGSSFTKYSYPGTYSSSDFHYCGTTGNAILDWNNQTQIQTCELEGLADLDTEAEYVRSRLAEYGNDLLSLGVSGFRLDSAKHINSNSLSNIVSRLTTKPYLTQEVLGDTPILPQSYDFLGDVVVSDYYAALLTAFTSGTLASLDGIENNMPVPSSNANVYVADHDTERDSTESLSYQSANNAYTLAHVFLLAYPYGSPTVLSSYTFSNTDQGAPNNLNGTCYGAGGVNGWLCQHRWTAIVGLVGFRATVGDAEVMNWTQGTSNQIAFARGEAGFVSVNNEASAWSSTFTTGLPDGTYCDVANGALSNGACSSKTYTISGGKVTASVGAYGAFAIHIGPSSRVSGGSVVPALVA